MSKSINILDEDYLQWVQDLCNRYRQSQIKAAVKVNKEMIRFYYELGRDMSEKKAEKLRCGGLGKEVSWNIRIE